MKSLLIIYPHWPPSNLVGVHRVRLVANELVEMDWNVTVLTIDERDYEEPADELSLRLVNPKIRVVKVRAREPWNLFGKRLIGDIGLRGYQNLQKKLLLEINEHRPSCAWISIPSWYTAMLGNTLHQNSIPFGIDYQDPWVHHQSPSTPIWSRAFFTVFLAKKLEPRAVRHAAFITGINRAYFEGTLERNGHLQRRPYGELQLGFSEADHQITLPELPTPWEPNERVFLYAGAFLPLSRILWQRLFRALGDLREQGALDPTVRIYLFGTGSTTDHSLQQLAIDAGVGDIVQETSERIPFLHVQEYMRRCEGLLSIGSTEAHYSASKTFQCLLARKKLLSFFHLKSEARTILKNAEADQYHTDYVPDQEEHESISELRTALEGFIASDASYWQPRLKALDPYHAKKSAQALIDTIQQAIL